MSLLRPSVIKQHKPNPTQPYTVVCEQSKVKFIFVVISGIYLGIFEGSHGNHRVVPEPMCLLTVTQAGHEHTTQPICLVHTDVVHIAPQRQVVDMVVLSPMIMHGFGGNVILTSTLWHKACHIVKMTR